MTTGSPGAIPTNGTVTSSVGQGVIDLPTAASDVGVQEVLSSAPSETTRLMNRTPKTSTVSLVIPTKNEAANISWVLDQVPTCVDEIVLVDGHSTDATLVTACSARPDIQVVPQSGVGKGDALRAGFAACTGDIVLMIDADGSMSPQEIPHFLYFLNHGYDFVKGSRFMAGGGSLDITMVRRTGNRALLHLVSSLYGASLTDLCYGFIGFHRRYMNFLDLTTAGFEVETRMVISAIQAGLRIAEVPSLEMPRRSGTSNLRTFRDGTRVLRAILRTHRSGLSGHAVQGVRHFIHRDALSPAIIPDRPCETST